MNLSVWSDFINVTLTEVCGFLMEEPIIYFVGCLLVAFVGKLVYQIIHLS